MQPADHACFQYAFTNPQAPEAIYCLGIPTLQSRYKLNQRLDCSGRRLHAGQGRSMIISRFLLEVRTWFSLFSLPWLAAPASGLHVPVL